MFYAPSVFNAPVLRNPVGISTQCILITKVESWSYQVRILSSVSTQYTRDRDVQTEVSAIAETLFALAVL